MTERLSELIALSATATGAWRLATGSALQDFDRPVSPARCRSTCRPSPLDLEKREKTPARLCQADCEQGGTGRGPSLSRRRSLRRHSSKRPIAGGASTPEFAPTPGCAHSSALLISTHLTRTAETTSRSLWVLRLVFQEPAQVMRLRCASPSRDGRAARPWGGPRP